VGALLVSLKLAGTTVLLAVPLGTAAAYAIHHAGSSRLRHAQVLLLLPMTVPHIILAIGVFYLFVQLQLLGRFAALAIAHTMLALPFVVVTVLAGLRSFDATQELVARSLGCTRLAAFHSVTLPQIRSSVLSGALFAFVTSLDEVVVSLFIAAGDNTTITKVMFGSLRDEIDPTIATVSSLLIAASFVLVLLAMLAARPARPAAG